MSQLLNQAKAYQAKFFIQFGGQGSPWLKELVKFKEDPKMKRFFDTAIAAYEDVYGKNKHSLAFIQPFEFKQMLENPDTAPDDLVLAGAGISLFAITVTQFAHFENLHHQGFTHQDLLRFSAGAAGHSQGLIASSFVALGKEGDDYYNAMYKYIQYMFYMGIRGQEAFPYPRATAEENQASEAVGTKDPAPMVAVLGESHSYIEKIVDQVNAQLPTEKKIYMSLFNTPENRILSSYRSSLIEFNKAIKPQIEEKKIKYVYLRSTCAFHCPHMNPIMKPFEKDIADIGFDYKGSDLKIPLYSFVNGRKVNNDDQIGITMYKDLMIEPLDWASAMKPVANDPGITHILDFGPGKTSQRLSQDTLAALNCQTPVLAVAFAKDLKTILE